MSLQHLHRFQTRLDRRERISRVPLVRLRDHQNPLEKYDAAQFKLRYHMNKDTAVFVTNLVSSNLSCPIKRGVHVPPVAVVRFYCTGGFQLSNADLHSLSQPTISNLVSRVLKAISKLCSQFVKFPNHAEAEKTRQAFYSIGQLPGTTIPQL